MVTCERTGDAVRDAERYFSALERESARRTANHARCAVCGNTIIHDECTVIDDRFPFDTAICVDCKAEQIKAARMYLSPILAELLEDTLYDLSAETPTHDFVA